MRFKIPWSEAAVLVALYTASAAWSPHGAATLGGLVTLGIVVVTALVARAITQPVEPRTWLGELVLIGSACCAIAVATCVHPAGPFGETLHMVRAAGFAAGAGCAVAIAAAPRELSRPSVASSALGLVAGGATFVAWGVPLHDALSIAVLAAASPVAVASIFVVRHSGEPDPERRARLIVPAAYSALAVIGFGLAAFMAWRGRDEWPAVTAGSMAIGWGGISIGTARRWLRDAGAIARQGWALALGLIAGGVVARLTNSTGGVAVAVVTTAMATAALRARIVTPDAERWTRACRTASGRILGVDDFADIATAVLEPLRTAARDLQSDAQLWILPTETKYALDVSGAALATKLSLPGERALLSWMRSHPGDVLLTDVLRPDHVRRPEVRPVLAALEERGTLVVLPLYDGGDLVGLVLAPRGRRRSLPNYVEREALRELSRAASHATSVVFALQRARTRAEEAQRAAESAERARADADADRDRALARVRGAGAVRPIGTLEDAWVGYSVAMRGLETSALGVAKSRACVTLIAEPGCAVESLVRLLHDRSEHPDEPCIVIDAAGVHPRDAVAVLVGSARVAEDEDGGDTTAMARPGWLEIAGRGTVAIVDVPALGYDAQLALAEALRTGFAKRIAGDAIYPVHARIVSIARGPLVAAGVPTELCERLEATSLLFPPLREREEDLEALVLFAIDRACRIVGRSPVGIRRDCMQALRTWQWPGNEHELFDVIERAVRHCQSTQLAIDDLPQPVRAPLGAPRGEVPPPDGRDADETYDSMERRILQSALSRAGGNKSVAARTLGLARTTFLDKLRKYGLRA